ncbi:hypothetical protein [Haloarcula rubripromontorii]|uniref:hypothetical protein n=1 Tax=Haloarcula rubripromontorii TaxID=1705562 RepID=UPI0012BA67F6|nr:hypothetical protein [Haloarcula rubripromontorii]
MTDWSNYVQYRCPLCQDNCINRVDHPATEANRCKQCHSVPSSTDTSEGAGELARPEAQRSEHPGPVGERQSPSAPARPTGSAPSRGDPEARTSPPNPEGEGNPNSDTLGSRRTDARSDGPK